MKRSEKFPTIATVAGWQWPPSLSLEQASSEAAAKYKQSLVSGNSLADLTGGMGIDTLFLSDKFSHTVYIEINRELCTLAEHNFALFQDRKINTVCATAEDFLQAHINDTQKGYATVPGCGKQGTQHPISTIFDCIYIDPARRNKNGGKVFSIEDCSPDLIQLYPILPQHTKQMLVKLSPMLDISLAKKQLPHTRQVHIVSINGEVKELLFLVDFTKPPTDNPELIIAELKPSSPSSDISPKPPQISLHLNAEQQATATYCDKDTFEASNTAYLYEPHPALLKAGLFKWTSEYYGIKKLAPNTHLYISNQLLTDFFGNIYQIEKETTKKQVKGLSCAVLARNYPIGAEQIRKEWNLREPYSDNRTYLICTKQDKHKIVFIANKLQ